MNHRAVLEQSPVWIFSSRNPPSATRHPFRHPTSVPTSPRTVYTFLLPIMGGDSASLFYMRATPSPPFVKGGQGGFSLSAIRNPISGTRHPFRTPRTVYIFLLPFRGGDSASLFCMRATSSPPFVKGGRGDFLYPTPDTRHPIPDTRHLIPVSTPGRLVALPFTAVP